MSEKIEDPGQHLVRNAYAIIANADDGLAAVARHRYLNAALRRRVFCGVVEKIGEHLRQAHRIALDDKPLIAQRYVRFVLASLQQGVAGLDRLMDDGGKVEMLFPELDLPARDARDLKQIVDEANEMIHLPLHHRQQRTRPFPSLRVADVGFLQDVNSIADGRERIAQLMGERRQKFVLATVGFAKRLLCLPAFGDVARHHLNRGLSIPDHRTGGDFHLHRRSVKSSPEGFLRFGLALLLDHNPRARAHALVEFRRNDVEGRKANDISRILRAKQANSRTVRIGVTPVKIHHYAVGTHFRQRAEALLALTQRFLNALARGDVLHRNHNSANFAFGIFPGARLPIQPKHRAIRAIKAIARLGDDLARESTAMHVFPALRHVRKDIIMRAAQHRLVKPVVAQPPAAGGEIAHVPIEHRHRRRRMFDKKL